MLRHRKCVPATCGEVKARAPIRVRKTYDAEASRRPEQADRRARRPLPHFTPIARTTAWETTRPDRVPSRRWHRATRTGTAPPAAASEGLGGSGDRR